MPQIILTDEQARILQEAKEAVEVRDPQGRILSFLQPMDSHDAEVVSRHRTRNQPRETIPAAKVQAHMRRLEEIRQSEGMDEAKMRDLLRRMQAGEEV
jgi:ACT domain-containing protein